MLLLFLALCANAPDRSPAGPIAADIFARPEGVVLGPSRWFDRTLPTRGRVDLPAQSEPLSAWREIRDELRRAVGESTYEIWLAPLELERWERNVLRLQAPAATGTWVAKRFGRVLEGCAHKVAGSSVRVVIADHGGEGGRGSPAREPRGIPEPADAELSAAFNPRYSFDQFIIGDGNRLAHAAALVVAEQPGNTYNPLFLHAPPGLGKTHLLHAIGNYVLAYGGGTTVRYTTAEAFTNQFIESLGSRSLERFKRAYRGIDVLLVDDVQFFASKLKTVEEFFHTFNELYDSGRQLVLSCDRLPRQLLDIEERLRERFDSGLVADIRPPDHATRLAILSKRAELDHLQLEDRSVLDLIAQRVGNNVRALEGALIRVVAYHSLTQRPIDAELTMTVLDGLYPRPVSPGSSITDIQHLVAARYNLSRDELLSPSKTARVAWPRQIAMHLTREFTDASLHKLGQAFGGRNHATILHACKRVSERLLNDHEAAKELEELSALLRHRQADRDC